MNSLLSYSSDGENSSSSENGQGSNGCSSEDSNSVKSPGGSQFHRSHKLGSIEFGSYHRRREAEGIRLTPPNDHQNQSNVCVPEKLQGNDCHDYDQMNDNKEDGTECKNRDVRRDGDNERKSCHDDEKSRNPHNRKKRCGKAGGSEDKNEKPYDHDDRRDREKREERDRRRDRDRAKGDEKDKYRKKDRNRDRDKDRDREKFKKKSGSTERGRNQDRVRDRRHMKDEKPRDWDKNHRRFKDKRRIRSRSRSKDCKSFISRDDRNKNKLAQLERLGIELKPVEDATGEDKKFYDPLATAARGKYAEQIQKRKLLWASKEGETKTNSHSMTANTWVGTTFTHDEDGKVTAKFKRLMGIKGDMLALSSPGAEPDILRKQEEMFTNMEQQYEVARTTTHTQRGVGLGYASGSLPFPR